MSDPEYITRKSVGEILRDGDDEKLARKRLKECGAILNGHFVLSSGLHSDTYIQCAKLFENPKVATEVCMFLVYNLAAALMFKSVDLVVSPAIGGIVIGYEIARKLGIKFMFCERVDGKFTLRRGFEIEKGTRVVVVEDVITTGKSLLETVECVERHGGIVEAGSALIRRSNGEMFFKRDDVIPGSYDDISFLKRNDSNGNEVAPPLKIVTLTEFDIKNYTEDSIPESLQKIPISKPGSRHLSS